jgi:hypothetical protein
MAHRWYSSVFPLSGGDYLQLFSTILGSGHSWNSSLLFAFYSPILFVRSISISIPRLIRFGGVKRQVRHVPMSFIRGQSTI